MSGASEKLLARQLRLATRKDGSFDFDAFKKMVGNTYVEYDTNQSRIDRANRLMAEELEEFLEIREAISRERSERLEELEKAQVALAASEARARHLAYHDTLTGLPNRAMLSEKMAVCQEFVLKTGGNIAAHCLDLDHFKAVNDTFGHYVGDELIQTVAAILVELCGENDTVARLGGDEFAIVQCGADRAEAVELASKIVERLSHPIELNVGKVHIGCSVGITLVENSEIELLEALRQADLALYRAKAEGRGTYSFFTIEMDAAARLQQELHNDLRDAIANGDIKLAYQPQVDGSGNVIGVEALARWTHAERGNISPTVFVPLAEETGLIMSFGLYVLRMAFEDAKRWPDLKVAVNVSAMQLRMKEFVPQVRQLIRECGIEPGQFEMEITEGVLLGDDAVTLDSLRQLRKLGFSLALDDFGTGYSSLGCLQRYQIDKIKIDRSFVSTLDRDSDSKSIIYALIDLARALDLKVIAEGVETEMQRAFLMSAGCRDAQGYLFSRPVIASEIDKMLPYRKDLKSA